jgi:hypothetical protein
MASTQFIPSGGGVCSSECRFSSELSVLAAVLTVTFSATANNGRRKELQQHFVLHLKVVGTLTDGSKVVLTETTTAPIVVRGRSPRNFQARKEIPLLGSSAGSRGQALVETGLGIVAGPLAVKPQDSKLRALNLELPRTAFTFSATKLPGSPMTMRSKYVYALWKTAPLMASSPRCRLFFFCSFFFLERVTNRLAAPIQTGIHPANYPCRKCQLQQRLATHHRALPRKPTRSCHCQGPLPTQRSLKICRSRHRYRQFSSPWLPTSSSRPSERNTHHTSPRRRHSSRSPRRPWAAVLTTSACPGTWTTTPGQRRARGTPTTNPFIATAR